ncbi:MAG: hypothetical protein HKN92_09000 [Chitinophagales bacterium]|nr:hypothetical protein [Chitinophagales bacterium]
MNNQGMLKNSILSKTIFTAICGIGLVVIAPYIGSVFNINTVTMSVVGLTLIGLIAPECLMFTVNKVGENSTKFVIVKDIMFITVCFSVLGFNLFGMTAPAIALTGIFSSIFASFSYLQHRTLTKKIEMQQVERASELKVVYIDAA